MNIYFAASIRGGRDDQEVYTGLIELLRTHGTVLTEHFGNQGITASAGTGADVAAIYRQDMDWVTQADVIVAEVTQPSLGVGYEIGRAETMGKRILCMYRKLPDRSLSAMIAGNSALTVKAYSDLTEAADVIRDFIG